MGSGVLPLAKTTRPAETQMSTEILECPHVGTCRYGQRAEDQAFELLGPVSSMRYRTSTPGLSTWWSATALNETWF
jgi:hypothetical protein